MKQIVFLFLTFYGIYAAQAQDAAVKALPDSAITKRVAVKDTLMAKRAYTISLLTNPVKNKVEIAVNGFDRGQVQVILTDVKGNRLRDDRRLLFGGSDIITIMFSLPAGIYFIAVKQKERMASRKMVVR